MSLYEGIHYTNVSLIIHLCAGDAFRGYTNPRNASGGGERHVYITFFCEHQWRIRKSNEGGGCCKQILGCRLCAYKATVVE